MKALQIDDKLSFMKHLLVTDTFDSFFLVQGVINTYNTFTIEGKINRDFYGSEYEASPLYGFEYTPWGNIRDWAYSLIKGKIPPVSFKFIMYANEVLRTQVLQNASSASRESTSSLVLTIKYDSQGLNLVTGTAQSTFSMDKTADEAWDAYISEFIQGMQ